MRVHGLRTPVISKYSNTYAKKREHHGIVLPRQKQPECLQYLLDNDCPLPEGWRYEDGELYSSESESESDSDSDSDSESESESESESS